MMNRLRKIYFVFLLIIALTTSLSCMIYESGSFKEFLMGNEPDCEYDNWLSHISEGIALPGLNAYPLWDRQTNGFGAFTLPDSLQTQQWNIISSYFVNQQWTLLDQALIDYNFPYDLVSFDDRDTERVYYMLRERLVEYFDDNGTPNTDDDEIGSFALGWGLAVFNPAATNPTLIMVPHPNDDYIAIPMAWKAFNKLNARYLMINGAGREVMWTNIGVYTNAKAISDPSRFAGHPLHFTYMRACGEIRGMLASSPNIIKREFSMQPHSYDSNLHIGFPSCQVSAGNGQDCPNLPIRDLSQTIPDIVNAAGYTIHPANSIGDNAVVLTNNFWSVNYSEHPFVFNDGVHQITVSDQVDLPGYLFNNQMLYSIDGWNSFDVYDPFFHIEMDELPDCYAQTDSTLAWFYGFNSTTQTWDFEDRYSNVMEYYQPWVDALQASLNQTLTMNDNQTPATPVIVNAVVLNNNILRINCQRLYEYDFDSWIVSLERRIYLGGGNYTTVDTLMFDRNDLSVLADQANVTFDLTEIPLGYHYKLRMAARDKSNRISAYTDFINVITYATAPQVTNLSYNSQNCDDSHISITWTPVPADIIINNYRIDRRVTGSTNWVSIATLPYNANQYTDGNFPVSDSLMYDYRVTVLCANQQSFVPLTYCTGYFRVYPAPEVTSIQYLLTGYFKVQWEEVTNTLSGHADAPDYYLVTKSTSYDFSSPNTYTIAVQSTQLMDLYSETSSYGLKCYYRITAMATSVDTR